MLLLGVILIEMLRIYLGQKVQHWPYYQMHQVLFTLEKTKSAYLKNVIGYSKNYFITERLTSLHINYQFLKVYLKNLIHYLKLRRIYFRKLQKGKHVKTTLDIALQEQSNTIVKQHYNQLKQNEIYNISVLVLDVKSREVLTYIGNSPTDKAHQNQVDIIDKPRST